MAQPSVILATASYDHTIRFWEAKSGRCYRTIQYPDSLDDTLPELSSVVSAGSDDEHPSFTLEVRTFRHSEFSAATANFNRNRQIGSGSSGQVYEGHLSRFGKARDKLDNPNNFQELVDPRLHGHVSADVLSMALAVANSCIMENDQPLATKSRGLEASSASSASRH